MEKERLVQFLRKFDVAVKAAQLILARREHAVEIQSAFADRDDVRVPGHDLADAVKVLRFCAVGTVRMNPAGTLYLRMLLCAGVYLLIFFHIRAGQDAGDTRCRRIRDDAFRVAELPAKQVQPDVDVLGHGDSFLGMRFFHFAANRSAIRLGTPSLTGCPSHKNAPPERFYDSPLRCA